MLTANHGCPKWLLLTLMLLGCSRSQPQSTSQQPAIQTAKPAQTQPQVVGAGPKLGVSKELDKRLPKTVSAQMHPFPAERRVAGEVFKAADETISLSPPSAGTIERILVRAGQTVERDQTLALLRASNGEPVSLYALYGGRIDRILRKAGTKATAETTVFQLSALKADWIMAHVDRSFAKLIKPGSSVRVAGTDLVGTVEEIGSEPEPSSPTSVVACLIPDERGHLSSGRKLQVMIEVPGRSRAGLGVPLPSVITRGSNHFANLVVAGKTRRIPIELARRSHGWVEVAHGLKSGDQVLKDAWTGGPKQFSP